VSAIPSRHRRTLGSFGSVGSLLVVVALVAAACGPSAPALTDPKEILTKAVEATGDAKSFHLLATLDGEFAADPLGTGGGKMTLTGTKLEGDVDIANARAKLTFAVPALLGITGELIAVDDAAYVKTSITGDLYQKSDTGAGGLPVDPADPDAAIASLKEFLDKPEIDPKKLDDVDCGSAKCYAVTIELTADEIAALSGDGSSTGLDPATVMRMTFSVDKTTLRFASVAVMLDAGEQGSLTVVLTFSAWDAAVTIEAPPDDQVGEGGGLPFP